MGLFLFFGIILTGFFGFLSEPFVVNGYRFADLGFLAWIYLVPLLLSIGRFSFKKKLLYIYLSSLITQFGLVYWLITAMHGFGGLNTLAAFGVLTAFALVFGFLLAIFIAGALEVSQLLKLPAALTLPIFMVCHDVLIHHFPFGGYPWGILPYSQGQWIPYFQWVDHTGIFGLSFFLYLLNGLAVDLIGGLQQKSSRKIMISAAMLILLPFLSMWFSHKSLQDYETKKIPRGELKLALIQGNISQDMKWNARRANANLARNIDLTKMAISQGAELVIWPETAYTHGVREAQMSTEKFLPAENLGTPVLFGSIIASVKSGGLKLYNSVIHANSQGEMLASYRKHHLVPFGEYLPFAKYLKFMSSLTEGVGEMTPGSEYVLFDVNGLKLAPLICIEDVFPQYAREFTKRGADLLINFTNDAWYGNSSAQHQHLVYSQFRALENRTALIRATNTGVTAVIDPAGKVLETLEPFTEAYLLTDLKMTQSGSYYTAHGNRWLLIVYGLFLGLLGMGIKRRRQYT